MVRMMCVPGCAWVCMVMPVVCWVVLFRYDGLGSFDLARLLSVDVRPSPLPACVRAHVCVIWWSFRGVHGGGSHWCVRWWWLFSSVCRFGVCLLAVGVSTSPVVHVGVCMSLRARVCVCVCVCV